MTAGLDGEVDGRGLDGLEKNLRSDFHWALIAAHASILDTLEGRAPLAPSIAHSSIAERKGLKTSECIGGTAK